MMNELASYLPGVKAVLIDERDRYLASKIWTSTLPEENAGREPPQKIAAIVGAGHMQGMIAHLEKLSRGEEAADVSVLDVIPPRTLFSKAIKFIIPAAIIALFAVGFVNAGTEKFLSMIQQWILWNGSLAAIGAIIALGHPLAVLVSFLGAPLTTLTPVIGVGFLSGLVQVTFRKPRVSDLQNISEDSASIRGVYRNRITRALLVFLFSSLGSSIATFVLIPMMTKAAIG